MNITDYVSSKIKRLLKGYVFTYVNFIIEVNEKEAIIKALNRMAGSGKITKLSKGKYWMRFVTLKRYQMLALKILVRDF